MCPVCVCNQTCPLIFFGSSDDRNPFTSLLVYFVLNACSGSSLHWNWREWRGRGRGEVGRIAGGKLTVGGWVVGGGGGCNFDYRDRSTSSTISLNLA